MIKIEATTRLEASDPDLRNTLRTRGIELQDEVTKCKDPKRKKELQDELTDIRSRLRKMPVAPKRGA